MVGLAPEIAENLFAPFHSTKAAGMGVGLSISRTIIEAVEHYGSAVFAGGAMVIDTEKQVTLHRTLMQPHLARAVCGEIEAAGQAALALQDTGTAGVDYLYPRRRPGSARR